MVWLILGGLVGLIVGGEILVRGAVGLARKMGVSDLFIGAVLVGFHVHFLAENPGSNAHRA